MTDNRLLSIEKIDQMLQHSKYDSRGMKYGFPISVACLLLFWILLSLKGMMEFLSAGIAVLPLVIIICVFSNITAKVNRAIKKRKFHIIQDSVADKIYKPGNPEYSPEYFLVFQKHGKYRLSPYEEKIYHTIQKKHPCYLLILNNSKKIRFIFDASLWEISADDFTFCNDTYIPKK